jgi:hypothetical protein
MPVAVELNGLLPGRGPGRGGPGTPGTGRPGEPPDRGAAPGAGRGAEGLGAFRVPASRPPASRPPASRPPAAGGLPAPGAGALAGVSGCPCGNGTGGLDGAGWPAAGRLAPVSGDGASAAGAFGSAAAGAGPASAAAGAGRTGEAGARPLLPPCPSPSDVATGALTGGGAARSAAAWPSSVLPARPCLGCWAANASLSLRTTGASMVEDADRTNSPISWSLAITALLSTPNSFASSYTRTFATALPLLGPAQPDPSAGRGSACSVRRQPLLFIAACSSVAHRNLSLLSRASLPRPCISLALLVPSAPCPAIAAGAMTRQNFARLPKILDDRAGPERPGQP